MGWLLLADAVVLFHVLFVAFAVAGGLLALRWRWMPLVHLPALAWGALVEIEGWICPLTPLENHLRALAGEGGYHADFLQHYLLAALYPAGLTRGVQAALAAGLIALNAIAYAIVAWRWWRK
jgi:hypothetical protein